MSVCVCVCVCAFDMCFCFNKYTKTSQFFYQKPTEMINSFYASKTSPLILTVYIFYS